MEHINNTIEVEVRVKLFNGLRNSFVANVAKGTEEFIKGQIYNLVTNKYDFESFEWSQLTAISILDIDWSKEGQKFSIDGNIYEICDGDLFEVDTGICITTMCTLSAILHHIDIYKLD